MAATPSVHTRRGLLTLAAAMALPLPALAQAEPPEAAPTTAAWLRLVAQSFRKSAEAMATVSGQLAALAVGPAAAAPLPPQEADAAAEALASVYQEFVDLRLMQTTETAPILQIFAQNPTDAQWLRVKARLRATQEAIARVDRAIAGLGPAFALTPLYPQLRENLGRRSMALDALDDIPTPRTPEELEAYREMVGGYLELLARMEALGEAFRAHALAARAAADGG